MPSPPSRATSAGHGPTAASPRSRRTSSTASSAGSHTLGREWRYLPFREDPDVHLHAGNGPWLAYSAWLAQHHAACGRPERFATDDGHLPEHVSTRERSVDFLSNEWETGLDLRKEFDPRILLSSVAFSDILEETNRMRAAYDVAHQQAERAGDGVIRFAAPLAWCHAEVAVALSMLDGHRE